VCTTVRWVFFVLSSSFFDQLGVLLDHMSHKKLAFGRHVNIVQGRPACSLLPSCPPAGCCDMERDVLFRPVSLIKHCQDHTFLSTPTLSLSHTHSHSHSHSTNHSALCLGLARNVWPPITSWCGMCASRQSVRSRPHPRPRSPPVDSRWHKSIYTIISKIHSTLRFQGSVLG
jgi:hypothetical protein